MDRHRPSTDARWQRIGYAVAPKLRLGRERLADDLASVEAVRDAVGDEVALMVDFNQGLALGEALERCHAIDDPGLAWIEEPLVYDDLDGSAQLAAELKTPMQMGENFYGPRGLYKALQMNACDYVMPDFMRIGGVTGWQRATPIAAAAGHPRLQASLPGGRRARPPGRDASRTTSLRRKTRSPRALLPEGWAARP